MAPKISIIFTSYNHKEFLIEALEGLLNQTFRDFELIVVDDCSTDGSQELLKKYAIDPRVKLNLLNKNTGSYVHSSNLGASKAVADYIIFAQCDDFAEKTQLESLFNVIIRNPNVGVVYSSSNMIDKNGKNIGCDFDVREKKFRMQCANDALISRTQMSEYFLYSCVIPNLSAALIRRSLFEKIGGLSSEYLVLADWDFWLKMTLECDFFYLRKPLNSFRQHDTTIRKSIKLKRQINEVFEMYYSFFKRTQLKFSERIKWEFNIASIWLAYFRSGKKAWLYSLVPLQITAIRYCFYFQIIFLIAAFAFPFSVLHRRLRMNNGR